MRTSGSGSDKARASSAMRRLCAALRQRIAPTTATTPTTTKAMEEGSSGTHCLLEELACTRKLDEHEDHKPAEQRDQTEQRSNPVVEDDEARRAGFDADEDRRRDAHHVAGDEEGRRAEEGEQAAVQRALHEEHRDGTEGED